MSPCGEAASGDPVGDDIPFLCVSAYQFDRPERIFLRRGERIGVHAAAVVDNERMEAEFVEFECDVFAFVGHHFNGISAAGKDDDCSMFRSVIQQIGIHVRLKILCGIQRFFRRAPQHDPGSFVHDSS